jgi:hypothetical protein
MHEFELALPQFIVQSGLLTDEFADRESGVSTGTLLLNDGVPDPLDERILPASAIGGAGADGGRDSYNYLQSVREYANQAIGALVTYDTIATDTMRARVMRGELYAMEGYAEIMLADMFCSGIPLSTLDFEQDYTLRPGSMTVQVYYDALAKFDTALVLSVGADSVMNLARVGRGRAWLNLGQYDSAAVAVTDVPTGFSYRVAGEWYGTCGGGGCTHLLLSQATIANREGVNGLPYVSSNDPRVAVVQDSFKLGSHFYLQQFPAKYESSLTQGTTSWIVVANGIEAQLIRAEAELQPADAPSGAWLHTLNQLRESVGLSDTTDPGTATGRISLLFAERAYWLFATGHRQGDLRRLLREYGSYSAFNDQSQVYPTGNYTAPGVAVYGSDVTVPVPSAEYTNPLFHGCFNRDA